MIPNKLRAYIASTCLANAFFIGGLLQPAQAKSSEPSKFGNPEDLLSTSSQDCPYRALLQDHDTGSDLSRLNWNEKDSESLNGAFNDYDLDHILNNQFEGGTSDSNRNEHDLDHILNSQFEQREILLTRCCT